MNYYSLILIALLSCASLRAQTPAQDAMKVDSILRHLQDGSIRTDTQWIVALEGVRLRMIPPEKRAEVTKNILAAVEKARHTGEVFWQLRAYKLALEVGNFSDTTAEMYADTVMMLLPMVKASSQTVLLAANQAEQVYYQLRKYVKTISAIKAWQRIAALKHDGSELYVDESGIYQKIGRYDMAKKILYDVLNKTPDRDSLGQLRSNKYKSLASVYKAENKLDSAIYFQRKAIDIREAYDRNIAHFYSENQTINHLVMANFFMAYGVPDSALRHLELAETNVIKRNSPDKIRMRSVWNAYADAYIQLKNYPKALEYLNRTEEHYKTFGNGWFMYEANCLFGKCYAQMGDDNMALERYEKAFKYGSNAEGLYLTDGSLIAVCDSLSHLYEKGRNFEKAIFYSKTAQNYRQQLLEETSHKDMANFEFSRQQSEVNALAEVNRQAAQKTRMAILGAILLFGLLGFALYQLRRNRVLFHELENEKQRSEMLLLNILPENIASRLKDDSRAIADAFEEATVIFIDIVGFTALSARHSPKAMVDMLNDIFVWFDRITDQLGLEKIKTIGDCYMAVGGLPNPKPDHLMACVQMGLTVLEESAQMQFFDHPIQFRIGIETGPVVAGIIGEKRFLYDLWGDVVNTASRMESNGLPNTIQITERVYEQVKDRFHCVERGMVDIKGKGLMKTWLIAPGVKTTPDRV